MERTEQVAADRTTDTVDVVFNNRYKAQAVVSAVQFKSLLLGEKVDSPSLLYEHYRAQLKRFAYPAEHDAAQSRLARRATKKTKAA